MDKLKEFVILPISIFVIELILQYNQSTLYYWKYLFISNANFPWQHILLGILAILLFVCGITVLFLWVFDTASLKSLLNQSTAKAVGIAFAIDYLFILVVEPTLYSLIELLYRLDTAPWLYLIFVSLIMTIQSFFVISMILWLVLKPLRSKFKFRTKTFLIAALVCLLLNVLYNYVDMQISMAFSNLARGADSALNYWDLLLNGYDYSKFLKIIGAIVYAIQDVIILVFINSCIKHKESVEIPNV